MKGVLGSDLEVEGGHRLQVIGVLELRLNELHVFQTTMQFRMLCRCKCLLLKLGWRRFRVECTRGF